jgi:hypothetical protein
VRLPVETATGCLGLLNVFIAPAFTVVLTIPAGISPKTITATAEVFRIQFKESFAFGTLFGHRQLHHSVNS